MTPKSPRKEDFPKEWSTINATTSIERGQAGVSKPGGFQTGGVSHFLGGKVLIVWRTISGMFLVGALHRLRKRTGTTRGKSPKKIRKIQRKMDAAFLLTVGSFLLTMEPFYLQLTI